MDSALLHWRQSLTTLEVMPKYLYTLLLILLPLAWGLGVDFLFEVLRRRQDSAATAKGDDAK